MAVSQFYDPITLNNARAAAGTGSAAGGIGVSLFTYASVTGVANVSTGETDLATYTLPANSLSASGQKIRITAYLEGAVNANNKTIKFYYGSNVIASRGPIGDSGTNYTYQIEVTRTGAAQELVTGYFVWSSGNNAVPVARATVTTDNTAANVLKVTGQSGTASNDLTCFKFTVEWIAAP